MGNGGEGKERQGRGRREGGKRRVYCLGKLKMLATALNINLYKRRILSQKFAKD